MTKNHWTLAVWLRIQEPRIVTVIQFFIYLAATAGGLSAVLFPPRSIEATAGAGLTLYWAWLLLLGGVLGAVAVLPGIWWLERSAVIACIGASLIYGVNILALHLSESGNRLVQFFMIVIVALHFGARWFRIRRYAYDPER
ncbi:hypothetical protein ART_0161 [Arthrobacter sp. PAMC 25486]|uniref:hypothetical protein n=1 Tax=Arthrobacter sp. PAMC 25486 TaxID=1494608 RepID=UPI000535C224|nr:hypothetical protein [Arthrobacter sp. PAMC 25486]AIX99759.1 hypothetical protein ART_0161 [Arthrobacter sp. PAMC 25486]